ncbi:hypothetical protein PGTUg99_050135 [Puccinia graminis f. sp. tritici]|uniref:OTU domain-containing protein n=1 Tax=Puccinia graminis f. sp. tritici TaxID=56615 RepID=A0A5B0M403_PUCGR|nr:hypothetical protein PGTUg99_050135 [Puccinia graminis f. sp. tritici]
MSSWANVTSSKSPEIYVERYNQLKLSLATCPAVLEYLEKWIIPVKELFVVAWACQYPHLRNLNTSRVESGHAYLKKFIKDSTGDLLSVFGSLSVAVDNQLNSVHESIGKDTTKVLVDIPNVFIPLIGKISTFAILECQGQFRRLKNLDPTEPCSQTLTKGLGIPCAHKIAEILEEGNGLSPADFHLQWHLQYNPESLEPVESDFDFNEEINKLKMALSQQHPSELERIFTQFKQIAAGTHVAVRIQAPEVKKNPKGRPSLKKKNSTSTKRDPSGFEIVESEIKTQQRNKKRTTKPTGNPARQLKRLRKSNSPDHEDNNDTEPTAELSKQPEETQFEPLKGEQKIENQDSDAERSLDEIDNNALLALLDEKLASHKYKSQVPKHLQHLVKDQFDPEGDGNCGFRCVARALGYDDNGFMRVRQEMITDLTDNRASYVKLQGSEQEVVNILNGLTVDDTQSSVPPGKWLSKLSHGQILANTYTRPIVFLSFDSCNTYLPLRLGPEDSKSNEPIYLLHVNRNHWVLTYMEEVDGVKPLPPPMLATKCTSETAKGWWSYIQQGLAFYHRLLVDSKKVI